MRKGTKYCSTEIWYSNFDVSNFITHFSPRITKRLSAERKLHVNFRRKNVEKRCFNFSLLSFPWNFERALSFCFSRVYPSSAINNFLQIFPRVRCNLTIACIFMRVITFFSYHVLRLEYLLKENIALERRTRLNFKRKIKNYTRRTIFKKFSIIKNEWFAWCKMREFLKF